MEKVPNGKYTKEFREKEVKLAADEGLSVPEEREDRYEKGWFRYSNLFVQVFKKQSGRVKSRCSGCSLKHVFTISPPFVCECTVF